MVTKKKTKSKITPKRFLKLTHGMSFGERTDFIMKNKSRFVKYKARKK